jgi:hypothetical protein
MASIKSYLIELAELIDFGYYFYEFTILLDENIYRSELFYFLYFYSYFYISLTTKYFLSSGDNASRILSIIKANWPLPQLSYFYFIYVRSE